VQTLLDVVLFIHLVGFGVLLGGGVVQLRDSVKVINSAMLYGALTQVVSGIALVGVVEGMDETVDSTKVAIKFGIALVIALLCWVNRAKYGVPTGLFNAIVVLTLANVAVAVSY
jgi:apolipoprotein N-acyltransferase